MKHTLDEQIDYMERVILAYAKQEDHKEKAEALELLNEIRDSLASIHDLKDEVRDLNGAIRSFEVELETEDI